MIAINAKSSKQTDVMQIANLNKIMCMR